LSEVLAKSNLKPQDFDGIAVAWKPYKAFSGFFKRKILDVPKTVLFSLTTKPIETMHYTFYNFFLQKVRGKKSLLIDFEFDLNKLHYFSHHLCHAASSYRTSGFDNALSVNMDCFGPDTEGNLWGGAAYTCSDNTITLLEYIPPNASMGLFYSAVSVCLGFKFGDGEGKTMGLAAYGNPWRAYESLRRLAPEFCDGKWTGPDSWSDFRLIDCPKLLFNTYWGRYLRVLIKNTSREDVAAAAQRILEEGLTQYFNYLISKTDLHKIALAGGTFLNVTFNRILSEREDVECVYNHPFSSDGGTAVGAALELYAKLSGTLVNSPLISAALGTEVTDDEIETLLNTNQHKIEYEKKENIAQHAASLIEQGFIIGWFQGRAEWGPRALGYRSVLGDPRNEDIKERLNKYLKKRDWFMPFAPSILEEYADVYFENSFYAPFMTFSFRVRKDKREVIPAAIHKDGTARPNIVRKEVNPLYYDLISEFHKKTKVPVILNTSFNRHGLPLIHTPQQAVDHLLWGCIDILIIGPFSVSRKNEIENVDDFSERSRKLAYVDEDVLKQAIQEYKCYPRP
jgi:carbamoyltransferase